jgi:hypothetical protein
MDCYKTICPKCLKETFWLGANNGFVEVKYPKCKWCGQQTAGYHAAVDRESSAGKTYAETLNSVLSGLFPKIED